MSTAVQDRITRREAEAMEQHLRPYLRRWSYGYEMVGSYRRGKDSMGDVDFILISGNIKGIISDLEVKQLVYRIVRNGGAITTILMHWKKKIIQVEFTIVSGNHYGAALLHSTGSAEFNTQLRTYAKQKGYLLNQYGLFKKNASIPIASRTEQEIFDRLGLYFIPPRMRDFGFWFIKDQYKVDASA